VIRCLSITKICRQIKFANEDKQTSWRKLKGVHTWRSVWRPVCKHGATTGQIRRRKHASGRDQIRKQCFEAWFANRYAYRSSYRSSCVNVTTIGWHTGLHTSRPVWTVTTIGMTTGLQTGRHTDRHVWTPLYVTIRRGIFWFSDTDFWPISSHDFFRSIYSQSFSCNRF